MPVSFFDNGQHLHLHKHPQPAVDAIAAPAAPDEAVFDVGERSPPARSADSGIGGQGVSQSEIDGLFEKILDEEPDESAGDGA